MAVLVEGVSGPIEIPYSCEHRRWYICREGYTAYLSERKNEDAIGLVDVPHHSTTIGEWNIESLS